MKTVKLQEDTHKALKIKAAEEGKPVEKVVDEMLKKELKNEGN